MEDLPVEVPTPAVDLVVVLPVVEALPAIGEMKRSEIIDLIKKLEHPRFVSSERTEQVVKKTINDMITGSLPSNVVSISMPKDINQHSESAKEEITNICNTMLVSLDNQAIVAGLKKILHINDKARDYITNRAREVLSHEKHAAVYDQLNQCVAEGKDLDAKNWAEAWIMIVELEDMINGSAGEQKC